jgi:hypothetical protein
VQEKAVSSREYDRLDRPISDARLKGLDSKGQELGRMIVAHGKISASKK